MALTVGLKIVMFQKYEIHCELLPLSILNGAGRSSEVERSLMVQWVVGSILHGVDPLNYFSFQPVLQTGVTKAVVCVILSVGWCI